MDVKYTKRFNKEISKITDKKLGQSVNDAIENVKKAKSILEIKNLKKLKGYNNSFRIEVYNYRIGIYIEKNIVEFARFMHRKDIYKYFP